MCTDEAFRVEFLWGDGAGGPGPSIALRPSSGGAPCGLSAIALIRVGSWYRSMLTAASLYVSGLLPEEGTTVRRRSIPEQQDGDRAEYCVASMDSKLFVTLGNVVAHLAATRFDDGSPRKPGRLFLETQGPLWRVVLKEPQGGLELVTVAQTIDDAFAAADLLLGSDKCPWMLDPWAHRDDDKKRKK